MRKSNTVNVLGRKYRVTRQPDAATSGFTDYTSARINVSPGQDEFATRDTLLHEVMHAIRFQQGVNTGTEEEYAAEEPYVRSLATGLIAFFRDNPGVAQWLITDPDQFESQGRGRQGRTRNFE